MKQRKAQKCLDCEKLVSRKTVKRCISCSHKTKDFLEKQRNKRSKTPAWNKGTKGICIAWNKGKKLTDEHRKKVGLATLERSKNPLYIKRLSNAHLGLETWNKGKKLPQFSGENNPRWKGGYENVLMLNRNRRIARKNAEGTHTLEQWQELKKKFNYMCLCCKQQEPFIKLTEDHIVPLIHGGTDFIENIQPLCKSCNSKKYTKTINYITQTC